MNKKLYSVEYGKRNGEHFARVSGISCFSVKKTFDCGQAFRFEPDDPDGMSFSGKAFGRDIRFLQEDEKTVSIIGTGEDDFENIWRRYLVLDEDYEEANRCIVAAMGSEHAREVMSDAVRCGTGIRILRQDPFEALISFIISQNNNIPRIKTIITALCGTYGKDGAFPTPEALVGAGVDGLFALRTGFRAAYIYDAAKKVLDGEISLKHIEESDDYDECTRILCSIKGVGPKVSSCALLYGFGKTEAFPIDVWMKRSLERHFPEGFEPGRLGRYAGIAQQYLFYYERWLGGGQES